MLSLHLLKMGAQQGVNLAKDILKELTSSKEDKTGDTTMVTASDTSIVAAGNSAGDAAASIVPETMKPAPGAPVTAKIGSLLGKGPNRTKLTKAANARLSEDIIYTYWDDHGQFRNNNPRKTGPYSSPAYKGTKEYQSYDIPHAEDHKKEAYLVRRGV